MKKLLLIAVAFFGLAISALNAQSSTFQQENCNPKICCPSTATNHCCSSSKAEGNLEKKDSDTEITSKVSMTAARKQDIIATKNKVAIVNTKK